MGFVFRVILFIYLFQQGNIFAQNVVQLFVENFNQPTISWLLNDSVSGPNIGTNNWIINNNTMGFP